MQKWFLIICASLFSLAFLSGFASAATFADVVTEFADTVWEVIEPLAVFLLGSASEGSLFMARILLFVILLSLVYIALTQFPVIGDEGNKLWLWVITLAFSILAIRFIDEAWIETIILPYNVFAIAMTAFFPLLVYFFFVEKGLQGRRAMRKIAWIFAFVVFIGMFIYRYDDLNAGFEGTIGPAWIYVGAAVASLIFLFADKTIQNWWRKEQVEHLTDVRQAKIRSIIIKQRAELEQELLDNQVSPADYRLRNTDLIAKEKKYKIR